MASQAAAAATLPENAAEPGAEIEVKPSTKRFSGKKLVLFFVAPVLLLFLVGGGGYVLGMFDGLLGVEPAVGEGEVAEAESEPSIFFDLPELLVNLNSSGKKASFLKMSVSLELVDEDARGQVEAMLPRLIDQFQVYLRELRPEDLKGSAGLYRLREELLLRANEAVKPAQVKDVLFKEMLVQ
jgi:flagellar FliL protein